MSRWRQRVAGALVWAALILALGAALLLWVWRAPSLGMALWACAALPMGARLWLAVAWRLADKRLATTEPLVRWQYDQAQFEEALAMLRRGARSAGALRRMLAPYLYRQEWWDEQSVTLLETGAVFGGGDWWRWDGAWRLSGAATLKLPGSSAVLLIQLRPRLPLHRWSEREIFAGRQLTMAIPVPPGQEATAERVASYLDRKR